MAEGTRSRTNQSDIEGITAMLQEILCRLESLDTRLEAIVERNPHKRMEKEERSVEKEERSVVGLGERVTKQTEVEFPSFDSNQVHEWLFKCERFFGLDDTSAEMKVRIASVNLSGLAMECHNAFIKTRVLQGPISWLEYADAVLTRFSPMEPEGPITQLKKLREENSYFTYVDTFVSLVGQVKLSDEDQVQMFVKGLKRDNKKLIMVLNPSNLQQAIAYATTLFSDENPYKGKGRTNEQAISSARLISWSNANYEGGGSSTKEWQNQNEEPVTERGPTVPTNKNTVYQPSHKRFTSAEIDEKRAKELCFWCNERFIFGHKCINKRLYSLILEVAHEKDKLMETNV